MTTERWAVPNRRLGLRRPKRAPRLYVSQIMRALPSYPDTVDNLSRVGEWGLYQNDRRGTCGPTSLANYVRMVTEYLDGEQVDISEPDVFDLYRRSGNPNFDPDTGEDDNGVDMQTMLEAFASGGLGSYKPVAFAAVDAVDPATIRACVATFGGVLFGTVLDEAQDQQFSAHLPWDYIPGSAVWGGHATVVGAYGNRFRLVTWAELQDATDSFVSHQNQEAWVVIFPEHLKSKEFSENVNVEALRAAYKMLTGRDLPFQPDPSPTPQPVDPHHGDDLKLVEETHRFRMTRHSGDIEKTRRALIKWMAARGLS
jgi:hypothetical protein